MSWCFPGRLLLAAVVLLVPGPVVVASAEGIRLASHRAVYELSLARPDPTGSVVALQGRLVMEFSDVCDGYALNQRIHTETTDGDDNDVSSDFITSSWESRDGTRFRFSLRNEVSGETTEEYVGTAELDKAGKGGTVSFTKPNANKMTLPPHTVFPNVHLVTLLRGAMAGETMLPVRVFDGSGNDGLFATGGHIGKPYPKVAANQSGVLKPLRGMASWPVRIAYFPLLSKAETPEYEIAFRLFANGISGDLLLDYGDYAMKGVLSRLDLLPGQGC
ncbi:MAG TPA: cell envelope integrity EipB family protein [Candidatus Sulfotelmatobacter sp.]|nr:cell envelope integrity EipB family protein [Candidatus Sulfotelmatobacter sp.]